jgi:hypothetical protein
MYYFALTVAVMQRVIRGGNHFACMSSESIQNGMTSHRVKLLLYGQWLHV